MLFGKPLDFVITLVLVTPVGWNTVGLYYGSDALPRCLMIADDLNAPLPKPQRGEIGPAYLCRCRFCGEPWP